MTTEPTVQLYQDLQGRQVAYLTNELYLCFIFGGFSYTVFAGRVYIYTPNSLFPLPTSVTLIEDWSDLIEGFDFLICPLNCSDMGEFDIRNILSFAPGIQFNDGLVSWE